MTKDKFYAHMVTNFPSEQHLEIVNFSCLLVWCLNTWHLTGYKGRKGRYARPGRSATHSTPLSVCVFFFSVLSLLPPFVLFVCLFGCFFFLYSYLVTLIPFPVSYFSVFGVWFSGRRGSRGEAASSQQRSPSTTTAYTLSTTAT